MNRKIRFAAAALAAVVTLGTVAGNTVYAADSVSITNVSYDPTRELYEQYNKIFQEHWKEKTGQDVDITQSHGGSGKQALPVLLLQRACLKTVTKSCCSKRTIFRVDLCA